ncbi:MAG: hypothetical protein RLZZ306_2535 [Bacteroidota bacterium]
MKPYPKYKPSDIQWLGDIPEHWKIRKVSRSFDIIGSGTTPSADYKNFYQDGTINWINTGDLNDGLLESCNKKITQSAFDGHSTLKIYPKGTLLIAMYGATIGKTSILGIEGCTNQACCALANSPYFEMQFAFYWFLANKEHIINLGYGGGQPNISQEVIRFLKITCPPLPEQTAIAQFLDQKTAQIDTLIAQKQRLITLLKEERMAFINEILSDESFPLKKLKYVVSLKSGSGITSDVIRAEGQYPVFGGNGLRGFYSDFTHDGEYILIGRQGALCGNINYTTGKFWASEHAIVVTILDNSDMKWLGELLRVMNLNQYSVAAAQPGLSVENIINLKIPYPPISKQIEISKSIETTTGKIDATLAKIVQEIELLKEYRVALISEVVTGKTSVV